MRRPRTCRRDQRFRWEVAGKTTVWKFKTMKRRKGLRFIVSTSAGDTSEASERTQETAEEVFVKLRHPDEHKWRQFASGGTAEMQSAALKGSARTPCDRWSPQIKKGGGEGGDPETAFVSRFKHIRVIIRLSNRHVDKPHVRRTDYGVKLFIKTETNYRTGRSQPFSVHGKHLRAVD